MPPKAILLLALAMYTLSCRSTRMGATPGAVAGQPTDSSWNAAFESKIETLRLRYHIPGLSAGIVYQGKQLDFIILANSQDLSRPFYHIAQPIRGVGFYKPFHKNLNNNLLASDFGKAFVQQIAGR